MTLIRNGDSVRLKGQNTDPVRLTGQNAYSVRYVRETTQVRSPRMMDEDGKALQCGKETASNSSSFVSGKSLASDGRSTEKISALMIKEVKAKSWPGGEEGGVGGGGGGSGSVNREVEAKSWPGGGGGGGGSASVKRRDAPPGTPSGARRALGFSSSTVKSKTKNSSPKTLTSPKSKPWK